MTDQGRPRKRDAVRQLREVAADQRLTDRTRKAAEAGIIEIKQSRKRLRGASRLIEVLRADARRAYERLLGGTDDRAWHSEHCYRSGSHRPGGDCICGLREALAILRAMWDAKAPKPPEAKP